MKKLKEYDQSIAIHAKEVDRIQDVITGLDPTTDEYTKASTNLKTMCEVKQTEVRSKNEYLAGKIPPWLTGFVGTAVGIVLFGILRYDDQHDGVFSSQALNIWDKVARKF